MSVQRFFSASFVATVLALAVPTFAQKPADAPKNSTAQCADGTFSTAKTQRGACSQHGGVKLWWGAGDVVTPVPSKPATASKAGTTASTSAQKGATGQCNDGSYTRAKTQRGACSQHGGVRTWFGASSNSKAAPPPMTQEPPNAPSTPPSTQVKAPTKSAAGAPENATAKCKDAHTPTRSSTVAPARGTAAWRSGTSSGTCDQRRRSSCSTRR
jgi:uncharacterized protein DUF3761